MGETYWELLPEDVLPNIAKFFKDSIDDYNNALTFANGSDAHRLAVMEAFEYRILFRLYDNCIVAPVLRCFGDLVREVSLTSVQSKTLSADLPRLRCLRKARILADDRQLALIEGLHSITTLAVSVDDRDNWMKLVKTVGSLPRLGELLLDFRPSIGSVPSSAQQLQLAEVCTKVEKLELDAIYSEEFWKLIKNLPSLRRLTLHGGRSDDENIPFLQKLDEVELCGGIDNSVSHAAEIGDPVTKLIVCRPQGARDIAKLRRCWKLRDLHICLEAGAERRLLGKINSVESLDLRWEVVPYRERYVYYKPGSKLLLDLVRTHPKLRKLGIFFAVVPIDIIERITEIMGDRLEGLLVPGEHQPESIPVRMERVLNAVAQWCPNITNLFLPWAQTYLTHHRRSETQMSDCACE